MIGFKNTSVNSMLAVVNFFKIIISLFQDDKYNEFSLINTDTLPISFTA